MESQKDKRERLNKEREMRRIWLAIFKDRWHGSEMNRKSDRQKERQKDRKKERDEKKKK